jgi:hypothetical protein
MKSVYREKLFYGIQHLENFLLIFFLDASLAPEQSRIHTADSGLLRGAKHAARNDD